jgi:hypothetical protein
MCAYVCVLCVVFPHYHYTSLLTSNPALGWPPPPPPLSTQCQHRNFAWSSFQRSPDPSTIPMPPAVFKGPALALTMEGDEEAEEAGADSAAVAAAAASAAAPATQNLTQDLKGILKLT